MPGIGTHPVGTRALGDFTGGAEGPVPGGVVLPPTTLGLDINAQIAPLVGDHRTWLARTAMSPARVEAGATAYGGLLWVAGGTSSAALEAYDPVTNTWTAKASMPNSRYRFGHLVVTPAPYPNNAVDALWVFMGIISSATNAVNYYRPDTNQWYTGASFANTRSDHTSAYSPLTKKVYVFGGQGSYTSVVSEFDPFNNFWPAVNKLVGFPGRAIGSRAVTLPDGRILVTGGSNVADAYIYDPLSNTYVQVASMPAARYYHSIGVVGGQAHVVGGWTGAATATMFAYDVTTNTWTAKPSMPTARYLSAYGVVNGSLHVSGGHNTSVTAHERYALPPLGSAVVMETDTDLEPWHHLAVEMDTETDLNDSELEVTFDRSVGIGALETPGEAGPGRDQWLPVPVITGARAGRDNLFYEQVAVAHGGVGTSLPAFITAGDLLVAVGSCLKTTTFGNYGWNIAAESGVPETPNLRMYVLWRRATQADENSIIIGFQGAGQAFRTVALVAVHLADANNPPDVGDFGYSGTTTVPVTEWSAPGVVITEHAEAVAWVVGMSRATSSGQVEGPPAFPELAETGASSTTTSAVGAAVRGPGPTGPFVGTNPLGVVTSVAWHAKYAPHVPPTPATAPAWVESYLLDYAAAGYPNHDAACRIGDGRFLHVGRSTTSTFFAAHIGRRYPDGSVGWFGNAPNAGPHGNVVPYDVVQLAPGRAVVLYLRDTGAFEAWANVITWDSTAAKPFPTVGNNPRALDSAGVGSSSAVRQMARLDDNRALVLYHVAGQLKAAIITVDGTSVNAGPRYVVSAQSRDSMGTPLVPIDATRFLAGWSPEVTGDSGRAAVLTVNPDASISVGPVTTLPAPVHVHYGDLTFEPLGNDRFLAVYYTNLDVDPWNDYVEATVLTVSGTTVTAGANQALLDDHYYTSTVALGPDEVFMTAASSAGVHPKTYLLTVDGAGTITVTPTLDGLPKAMQFMTGAIKLAANELLLFGASVEEPRRPMVAAVYLE